MSYYKFKETDIFHNQIKTHPKKQFLIFDSKIYLDNQSQISGTYVDNVPNVPTGHVSLYELNVDRSSEFTGLIYPFVTRAGNLTAFRTITTGTFFATEPGDTITSTYPLSASIVREFFTASTTRDNTANRIGALQNTLDYYQTLSRYYAYSSSLGQYSQKAVNLISVPSIFYGSSIKKGSVDLRFYLSGTLIGRLRDENLNGELIQTEPYGRTGTGSVAGVVLYNEGFVLLTGSWTLGISPGSSLDFTNADSATAASWLYYAVGANDGIPAESDVANSRLSASYSMEFKGTNFIPTITMFAHAPRAELNYSNNPTYIDQSTSAAFVFHSSSVAYIESDKQTIKNTIKSSYAETTASYKPQTFISKVGIFDKDKNLIAVAKVATPVKKTEDRDLTFKLKLDF
jgi:hypothetical protein